MFDGESDFQTIAETTSRKFKGKIESRHIELFAQQLIKAGILVGSIAELQRPMIRQKKSLFARLLFIKLKAVNPEKFIENTYELARPFYSGLALKFYVILGLFALIITIANSDEMLIQVKNFFRPEIIPLAWITIFFVTLIHGCLLAGGR